MNKKWFAAKIGLLALCLVVAAVTVSAHKPGVSPLNAKRVVDVDGDGVADSVEFYGKTLQISSSCGLNPEPMVFDEPILGADVLDMDRDGSFDVHVQLLSGKHQVIRGGVKAQAEPDRATLQTTTTFQQVFTTGTGVTGARDAVVGDFDNDGNMDIFTTTSSPYNALVVYEKSGNNTYQKVFTSPQFQAPDGAFQAVTAADMDNDSHMELIAANYGSITIYENTGNNQYYTRNCTISEPLLQAATARKVMVGNLDDDNLQEIVYLCSDGGGFNVIFVYEICGAPGIHEFNKVDEYFFDSYVYDFTIGNSDHDSCEEIILGIGGLGNSSPSIRRLEYEPSLGILINKTFATNLPSGLLLAPLVRDFDQDIVTELAFGGSGPTGGTLYVFDSPANDQYTLTYSSGYVNGNIVTLGTGMMTGFQRPIIVGGSSTGQLDMWTRREGYPPPVPYYEKVVVPSLMFSGSVDSINLANMDGDTRTDLVTTIVGGPNPAVRVCEQALANGPVPNVPDIE